MNFQQIMCGWRLRDVGAALGVAVVGFGLVGAAATRVRSVELVNEPFGLLASRTTLPAAFGGGLLLAACALAIARGRADGDRAWRWRLLAALLAIAGIEELTALHEGVQRWTGDGWETVWAPTAVVLAVLGIASAVALAPSRARRPLIACWSAWLAVQVAAGMAAGGGGWIVRSGAETLELAVAAAFALVLLAALQEAVDGPPASADRPGPVEAVVDLARACDPRRVAIGLAALIATLGVLGALVIELDAPLPGLSPRGERNVFSIANAALLAAVATLAATYATRVGAASRWAWAVLTAFLGFMFVDELFGVHERLDTYLGIPGQVVYLPLAVPAALAALTVARQLADQSRDGLLLLAGGATLWAIAQGTDVDSAGFGVVAVAEEMIEMAGSSLLLLGMVAVLAMLPRVASASGSTDASTAMASSS